MVMDVKADFFKSFDDICHVIELSDDEFLVTMPYLDRLNDWMTVKVMCSNAHIRFTDCGYVYSDLFDAGIIINKDLSNKYYTIFNEIIANFNCSFEDKTKEVFFDGTKEYFAENLMLFFQAISNLDFLAYQTQGFVTSRTIKFKFQVENYFTEKGCSFIKNFEYQGQSGIKHAFDFKMHKGLFVDIMSENNIDSRLSLLYKWSDVQKAGLKSDYPFYAISNYKEGIRKADKFSMINETMSRMDIITIPWDKKDLIDRYIASA